MRALRVLAVAAALAPWPQGVRAGDAARALSHYLAARRCLEADDWPCAREELERAVAADGASAELRVALAEALALAGELGRAAAEARRAIALEGTSPIATRAHVLLAQLARGRDRAGAALELRQAIRLEAAVAGDGDAPDPEPWALLAVLYLEAGDEAAAQRTLDDLASRAPGEGAASRAVGRWLVERREPLRAERHLRRAVQADPDDADAWSLLARVHRALGRSREVKDDLEAVLRLRPDDPEALLGLGRAALVDGDDARARVLLGGYADASADRAGAGADVAAEWLAVGRPEEALQLVRELLADAGPDARLHLAEGRALQRLRRWPEAARALAQVRAEDGDPWVPARVALSAVLAREGRHADAARALAAALRVHPGDVRLLVAQAAVLERAGQSGEADAALARAAEARDAADAPAADALRSARAAVLCRAGRAADAVSSLAQAVAARPRSSALRLALADAAEAAGNPDRAEAELRVLLALEPDRVDAVTRLARLRLRPDAAPGAEALAEAERLARRALEVDPRAPEALEAMGRALSRRGDHGGAAVVLARAAAISGSARFEESLGDALLAGRRPREAAAAYRRALTRAQDEVPAVAARMRVVLRVKLRDAEALASRGRSRP